MEKPTIKQLMQTMSKGIARIETHIGANGDAHLPATHDVAGFMLPEDKAAADNMFRMAKEMPAGTDILTLGTGIFIGRSWKNAPSDIGADATRCIVIVDGFDYTSYERITFIWITTAKEYKRYIYTKGSPTPVDSGWLSGAWQAIAINNIYSGYLMGRKIKVDYGYICELKFEITVKGTFDHGSNLSTLPATFANSDGHPFYSTQIGFVVDSGGIRPVGVSIEGGSSMKLYMMTTDKIEKVSGHIIYSI